ncbi:MAG: UDP-N-acetylglucosamine 1-carboxyvinyltransferase [Candidatus Sumerlaeia bacterium]|nr:UDP-N-acetylglucosamine 1-carboxyvinyltransferase [Candidatus Sumerlaeia bacterium]
MPLWMYEIEGARPLQGRVRISGSKNASLALLAAALLADGPSTLRNVPILRDTLHMIRLIEHLGAHVTMCGNAVIVDPAGFSVDLVPYDIMSKMRASFYAMGPMLAKLGRARVSLPGGCAIGDRPVDLHLEGFKALGAGLSRNAGYIHARHRGLVGARLSLMGPNGTSVGATINVMMVAAFAEGSTTIDDAAREPEVVEVGMMLQAMGAKIDGLGTNRIRVEGVNKLRPVDWTVSPDRIEAGTYLIGALATHGDVTLENVSVETLEPVITEAVLWGADFSEPEAGCLRVRRGKDAKRPLKIVTEPWPGFPTDMQSVFTTLLALTPGVSQIRETIYQDRFNQVPELNRLGAKVSREKSLVSIEGVAALQGAAVMASDLRAGAALVMAALAAHGTSQVRRVYHVERGYEYMDSKLRQLGAVVRRVPEVEADPGLAQAATDTFDAQVEALSAGRRMEV